MPLARESSPARALEDAVFAAHQVQPTSFAPLGRLARGGRRPLSAPVGEAELEPGDEPASLRLGFLLPPGSYATVLLSELCK
jgi:tRNA(Glu) U13 pseudouridine synthase TruD